MRLRWRLVIAGAVAASISLGVYIGTVNREARAPESTISEAAISHFFAARLNDSNGKPQPLSQWQGKTLVINFWATWCPPCREEMPAFSRLQTKHAANGVQFVGIALDTPENVSLFQKQYAASYPLLMAESEGIELSQQLGNYRLALPYTVVIGADKKSRLTQLGRVSERELDKLLGMIALQNKR